MSEWMNEWINECQHVLGKESDAVWSTWVSLCVCAIVMWRLQMVIPCSHHVSVNSSLKQERLLLTCLFSIPSCVLYFRVLTDHWKFLLIFFQIFQSLRSTWSMKVCEFLCRILHIFTLSYHRLMLGNTEVEMNGDHDDTQDSECAMQKKNWSEKDYLFMLCGRVVVIRSRVCIWTKYEHFFLAEL